MAEYEVLTQLLAIPHYEVIGVTFDKESLTVDLHSTVEGAICPRCGQWGTTLHENHARLVRDLPISGKACYLRFVRRRFFCSHCRRPFSEPLDFVEDHRDYTRRYQAWIFQQVKENNIASVQRLEGLTVRLSSRRSLRSNREHLCGGSPSSDSFPSFCGFEALGHR